MTSDDSDINRLRKFISQCIKENREDPYINDIPVTKIIRELESYKQKWQSEARIDELKKEYGWMSTTDEYATLSELVPYLDDRLAELDK